MGLEKISLHEMTIGENPSYILHFNLAEIANALGMNYNTETNVIYMGDNPNNGFHFVEDGSNVWLYLYRNGENLTDYIQAEWCANANSYIYYKKFKNTVMFGISDSNNNIRLPFMCGKANSLSDNSEKYGYMYSPASNNSNSSMFIVMEDGYGESRTISGCLKYPNEYVQMIPLYTDELYSFENIYLAVAFKYVQQYQIFTLNNQNYLSQDKYYGSDMRLVMEI